MSEVQPFQVSNVFEQNGKLFLKTFLIDDSVNGAKWGIVNEYIPKHIDKFVGRPFILTQTRTHPPEFYGAIREDYNDIDGTINRYLRAQEKYRIGTIRKVEPSTGVISASSPPTPSSSGAKNSGWVAYVEITDPAAIQAFKSGHVPKYVSPTVFRLKHEDPPDATTDYEPLHLAAVDVPAYSIDKAGIRGSCTGDLVSCTKQLAQASLPPIDECGFCVKGTLEGFQNQLQVNSSFVDSGVKQASELTENNDNASVPAQPNPAQVDTQKQEQPQQQQQPTQPTPTTPPSVAPNTTGAGQPFTKVEPTRKEEQVESGTSTKKEAGTESTNDKSKSTAISEVAELHKTVQSMLEEMKELKSYKQNQEKIERSNKDAAKRAKIESAIPENYADSPDERKKAVETLMHYSNDEQLDYILQTFVAPTVSARSRAQPKSPLKGVRNAASTATTQPQQQQSKQLTDFGSASANVQQASIPTALAPADMHRMEQICSMSDLVTRYRTSDNSGGAF